MTSVPVAEPPPRAEPGAATLHLLLPASAHPAVGAPRAAARVARRRLLRVARSSCSCRRSGTTDPFTREVVHEFTLENFRRIIETPVYRDVAWRTIQMAAARDDRGHDPRVPDRLLHGADRLASDARTCSSSPSSCRCGRTTREGLRVADDPLRRRRHQLGARPVRAPRSTGSRRSASGSSSRTSGCRSWSCRSTRASSGSRARSSRPRPISAGAR